ncbi:hypothetical protein HNP36_003752 [Chryseobacterium shigense]|uniref:Uncharacterized protein n=1 Tax=Chryseobacterium shigense TaxID=297244 RepID=A0A841N6Y2_9FLAO|nr:hypothetical protein [Chryseobacterium shigense]
MHIAVFPMDHSILGMIYIYGLWMNIAYKYGVSLQTKKVSYNSVV